MKYCPECGGDLVGSETFCSHCGAPLKEAVSLEELDCTNCGRGFRAWTQILYERPREYYSNISRKMLSITARNATQHILEEGLI